MSETSIKISELTLARPEQLSLFQDDRFIFNDDNVNTRTISFADVVTAICDQDLTFRGNCQFLQGLTGPDGGDLLVYIDDLVDVRITNKQSGQLLQYNGAGEWVNVDPNHALDGYTKQQTDEKLLSKADISYVDENTDQDAILAKLGVVKASDDSEAGDAGVPSGNIYFDTTTNGLRVKA